MSSSATYTVGLHTCSPLNYTNDTAASKWFRTEITAPSHALIGAALNSSSGSGVSERDSHKAQCHTRPVMTPFLSPKKVARTGRGQPTVSPRSAHRRKRWYAIGVTFERCTGAASGVATQADGDGRR